MSILDTATVAARPASAKATFTATDPAIVDGDLTFAGCKRDTDGIDFVSVTRGTGEGAKTRYLRADHVLRYAHLLATATVAGEGEGE